MAVPLLVIRSFRLTRIDTYAVAFVFAIGIISISATIVRIFYLNQTGVFQPDFHGNITLQQQHHFELISSIEVLAALIAFCLPAFRFLLKVRFVRGGPGISSLSWASSRFRSMGEDKDSNCGVHSGNVPRGTEETTREDLEGGRRVLRGKTEVSTEMIVLKTGPEKEDRGRKWMTLLRGTL